MVATALLALMLTADWPTIVKPLTDQTVRIEAQIDTEQETAHWLCSGVVIDADRGYVLTAAHCVNRPPTAVLTLTINRKHATLIKENRLLDIAVLQFDAKGEKAITLAETVPMTGEEVALVGFAYGRKQLYVQIGRVALPTDEDGRFVVDVTTIRGDSGGPLINARGELVGIVSAIEYSGGYLGSAVALDTVRSFVKAYLPKAKTP